MNSVLTGLATSVLLILACGTGQHFQWSEADDSVGGGPCQATDRETLQCPSQDGFVCPIGIVWFRHWINEGNNKDLDAEYSSRCHTTFCNALNIPQVQPKPTCDVQYWNGTGWQDTPYEEEGG